MDDKSKLESITQNLRQYVESKWELFLLKTSDKASDIISSIASVLLITVSLVFVLLFLSIGAALWIGKSYNDASMGFLFIGLFYLIVSVVLILFRHSLIKIPIINKFIAALYADEED